LESRQAGITLFYLNIYVSLVEKTRIKNKKLKDCSTEKELTPDVHLGRIPVRTIEQAEAYVNKVVIYETSPSDGFANSMILFGAWGMSSGNARPSDFVHHDPVSAAELAQMRMYYDFIQPSRQAMPLHSLWDAYSSWDVNTCGDCEFTRDRLIEQINQGHHFLFAWGHGNPGRWGMEGRRFDVQHAAALTNSIPSVSRQQKWHKVRHLVRGELQVFSCMQEKT
jgi:hypothetical protein